MSLSIGDIRALFEARGGRPYEGAPVTVLQHALQSAALAQAEGAGESLVAACLLHDLGHLLDEHGAPSGPGAGGDDLHQYAVLPFLRGTFGDAILDPILHHVEAGRWLCRERAGYFEALPLDAKRGLMQQGGAFTAEEAGVFAARAHAQDAIRLRLWDDRARVRGLATPDWAHFEDVLRLAEAA